MEAKALDGAVRTSTCRDGPEGESAAHYDGVLPTKGRCPPFHERETAAELLGLCLRVASQTEWAECSMTAANAPKMPLLLNLVGQ